MAYTEKRVGRDGRPYYRGRYKRPDGKYGTVTDPDGTVIRFPTKRTALKAGQDTERDAETAAHRGKWTPPEAGRTLFADYVLGTDDREGWLAGQELAESSTQSYGHYLKHLIRAFGDRALADIDSKKIDAWEKREKATGAAASSVRTYRKILHLILADAVDAGLIGTNAATRRRGRGKRAGRASHRGPEKKITTPVGMLLVAERAALLSGRDDEFVACVLTGYTGMRWGEVVGLETRYARTDSVRIEWQLYELDSGQLDRCPPKDDSYRDIDTPPWLSALVSGQVARTGPRPCVCHHHTYVFRGRGAAGGGKRRQGPTLADVARQAGVSTGTVSTVLNRPERVRPTTRARVEKAAAELGYVRRTAAPGDGVHWRRSGFATWIFEPAASGWYPPKSPSPRRPVPVTADPWPGLPVRGRNAEGRAETCWTPVRHGLTRHGLRHTHRTLMEELGTPKVLMDERMGHADGSVSALYSHVTPAMRQVLMEGLTRVWHEALDARLAMSPSSPVPVLDRLLHERRVASGERQ